MIRPKYSIVLPVLNGAELLQKTFPEMLKIDRDDIEFVISNNLSEDETKEIILDQNDKRVKYFEPEKRLPLGEHTTFAYSNANGQWQGHIGHDDHLFPSRFDYADKIIQEYDPQLVKGEAFSYTWPNYPLPDMSNTFGGCNFNKKVELHKGKVLAEKLINQVSIPGGGMWMINRSIMEKVWNKIGNRTVLGHEFFFFRAGALLADKVVFVNYPFFMQGVHSCSGGTDHLDIKLLKNKPIWDVNSRWKRKYCPFRNLGYFAISMDAAMQICDVFKEELNGQKINPWFWLKYAKSNFTFYIDNGQIPPENIKYYYEGRKTFPLHLQIMSMFREIGKDFYRKFLKKEPVTIIDDTLDNVYQSENSFGWPNHLKAELFGLDSMKGAPAAIEKYFEDSFHFKEL